MNVKQFNLKENRTKTWIVIKIIYKLLLIEMDWHNFVTVARLSPRGSVSKLRVARGGSRLAWPPASGNRIKASISPVWRQPFVEPWSEARVCVDPSLAKFHNMFNYASRPYLQTSWRADQTATARSERSKGSREIPWDPMAGMAPSLQSYQDQNLHLNILTIILWFCTLVPCLFLQG